MLEKLALKNLHFMANKIWRLPVFYYLKILGKWEGLNAKPMAVLFLRAHSHLTSMFRMCWL